MSLVVVAPERLAAAATDHQPRGKNLQPLVPEFKSAHRVTCLEGSFPPLPSKFSISWFPVGFRVIRAPIPRIPVGCRDRNPMEPK